MKILIGIPTYSNSRFGYTIRQTLEALINQSFKDFRVLIIYKPSPSDRTLDVIDEFRDELDIEVKIQSEGFVEEAMNMIFEIAKDYDITLTTDDDAVPTKTWIEEHVKFHKSHEKVGIAQGVVVSNYDFCYEYMHRLRSLIGYHKPLLKELSNYGVIINDMGLLACRSKELGNVKDYVLTISIGGVNMSFKSKHYINCFALPGYTKRGIHYERLLVLYYIKQKLHSAFFNGGIVEHLERDSLSRPKDSSARLMMSMEWYLLPYGIHYYGFKLNMRRLKFYNWLIDLYSRFKKTLISKAYAEGLKLAIEAIENNYEPREVRSKLLEIEKKAKYG